MRRNPNTVCARCNAPIHRSHRAKVALCSACQPKRAEMNHASYIFRWKAGNEHGVRGISGNISHQIRKYLLDKFESKCSRCGWAEVNPYSKTSPLQVEHLDGNHTNNSEDNLTILCPNCHSLTATYMGLNRGNGRRSRYAEKG